VTIQQEPQRKKLQGNTPVITASEPASSVMLPSSATSAKKALDLSTLGKPTT
jgi:hypothetical protein